MFECSRVFAVLMLFTGCCGLSAAGSVHDIVINEFMASNGSVIRDGQGQYEDWIELYNTADRPVDAGGLYLTDDLAEPAKWQIPIDRAAETMIDAHGYLIIWADENTQDSGLHASFGLSASGEEVGLFHEDGMTAIDWLMFPEQTHDMSYGRFPVGHGPWQFMIEATPGKENTEAFQGVTGNVQASHAHGFYRDPITLELTTDTPDAEIWVSLDCLSPHNQVGRYAATGTKYSGPIQISQTTCIRAIAVKEGWKDSRVLTQTYLFVEDIIHQSPHGERPDPIWPLGSVNAQTLDYGMDPDIITDPRYADLVDDALVAIPSISLVTETRNLFDSRQGIYVNASMRGPSSERPVSVELIHPDGAEGFQIDAGLRIRGGYSRSGGNPKHAFRLFFGSEYGASELTYPLFGDEGVDHFANLDLRTSQNYSWSYGGDNRNTMVREVFSRDAQRDMGQPHTRSRYVHLYLNGQYWGLYQTQERSEASYAESYFGGTKDDYDVVKSTGDAGGYTIEATDGSLDAWRRLWDLAKAGFNEERYCRAQGLNPDGTINPDYEKLLDVDNLIDYMLCVFYVGDFDAPISGFLGNDRPNNFFSIYNRVNPDGFKFFRHDAEHSLLPTDSRNYDRTGPYPAGNEFQHFNPQWLHQQLTAHPEYRWRFANRTFKHFFHDGVFTPAASQARILARADQIETAIIAESARWGDSKRASPFNRDSHWWPEVNMIVNDYMLDRTDIVLGQLQDKGWYPLFDPPQFSVNGQPQGSSTVAVSAQLSLLNPNHSGDIYYSMDGQDPRSADTAEPVTEVIVGLDAPRRYVVPYDDDLGQAWIRPDYDDSQWTETRGGIGYDWTGDYEPYYTTDLLDDMWGMSTGCLIRIPFSMDDPCMVGRLILSIQYDDGFAAYLNGTRVAQDNAPAEMLWNSTATQNHNAMNQINAVDISSHQGLLVSGRNVLAIHGLNASANSTDFLISAQLVSVQGPVQEGGLYRGPLTLTRTTQVKACVLRNNQWSAMHEAMFSVGPVAENLRISELMYHPQNDNEEYVELVNIGDDPINLNFVRFTRGLNFEFGDVTLTSGETVLVVQDVNTFEAAYGSDLNVAGHYTKSLSNSGERIELKDALGQTILDFRYEDHWYPKTDGKGYALEASDLWTAEPNQLSDVTAWRQGVHLHGSPGFVPGY
ncbi:MAG: lamin tail domain-containing protein [Phycisphaerae bacterium]|nr:lamin tail domain-containing protein [Phycisphaerae bacterium]